MSPRVVRALYVLTAQPLVMAAERAFWEKLGTFG